MLKEYTNNSCCFLTAGIGERTFGVVQQPVINNYKEHKSHKMFQLMKQSSGLSHMSLFQHISLHIIWTRQVLEQRQLQKHERKYNFRSSFYSLQVRKTNCSCFLKWQITKEIRHGIHFTAIFIDTAWISFSWRNSWQIHTSEGKE